MNYDQTGACEKHVESPPPARVSAVDHGLWGVKVTLWADNKEISFDVGLGDHEPAKAADRIAEILGNDALRNEVIIAVDDAIIEARFAAEEELVSERRRLGLTLMGLRRGALGPWLRDD